MVLYSMVKHDIVCYSSDDMIWYGMVSYYIVIVRYGIVRDIV